MEKCIDRYGLKDKHDIDMERLHEADYDSLMVHYLMEQFRSTITVNHSGESMVDSTGAFARGFDQEMAKSQCARSAAAKAVQDDEAEFEKRQAEQPAVRNFRRRGQRSL